MWPIILNSITSILIKKSIKKKTDISSKPIICISFIQVNTMLNLIGQERMSPAAWFVSWALVVEYTAAVRSMQKERVS